MHRVALVLSAAIAVGCSSPRRVANQGFAVGVQVAPANATGGDDGEGQTTGGVFAMGQVAETDEDWVSGRGRVDGAFGFNGNGIAGQLTLDGQIGLALFDGADHVFGRVGLFGTVESDPVTSYSALELPTVWLGYQHHGESVRDTVHFDVGPRASLGLVGRSTAPDGRADFVGAPMLGGAALLMIDGVSLELTYSRVVNAQVTEVVRGSACLAMLFAVCVDLRHVVADYEPGPWTATTLYQVRLGAGFVAGTSPPL